MADADATSPLAEGQIEIWKKIVDVQQHFNDLELRIRNFALVVTGAFLGLGGYAIKDGGMLSVWGVQVSVAGLVVLSAVLPLFAFYFMDRLWYHRLLDGAVQAGIHAESTLKALGYQVDLGSSISAKSPFSLWVLRKEIHSKTKMDIFYCMLLLALLSVAGGLGFGIRPQVIVASTLGPVGAASDTKQSRPSPGPAEKAAASGDSSAPLQAIKPAARGSQPE